MRKFFVFCCLIFATAPIYGSDFSIIAGWSNGGELEFDPETIDLKTVGIFGVRYEKDFAEVFGFENSLAYTKNALTAKGETGQSGFYYSGNLVLNLPAGNIVPNVTAGMGFAYRAGDSLPDVGTTFITNLGGGIKFKLAGPVGFRIDYRRFQYWDVLGSKVGANEITGGILISF
jgi:hypothetical protein